MGANNSTANDSDDKQNAVYNDGNTESEINIKIKDNNDHSDTPVQKSMSVPSPLNTDTRYNFSDSVSPQEPYKPSKGLHKFMKNQEQNGGNIVESEINVHIENMSGGEFEPESSIEIFTETLNNYQSNNNDMTGGGDNDPNFDSNKLLDIIMQMGGDNESESDPEMNSESSDELSDLNTSSFEPKERKSDKKKSDKKKSDKKDTSDDDSESDDDSDSESESDSDSEFDDDSDSDSDSSSKPLSAKHVASHLKNAITKSDVVIMTESESDAERQISLVEFNDPLKIEKSKKSKKSRY